MIRNQKFLEKFENEQIKKSKNNYFQNLTIFEMLLKYAKEISGFKSHNILFEIEDDTKYARAVNGIKRTD